MMNAFFDFDKKINHLEIASTLAGITVRKYHNEEPLGEDLKKGFTLQAMCMQLSDRGWGVRINRDKNTAKATIGAPARIDIHMMTGNKATVRVWADCWTASTKPMREYEKELDLAQEATNLEDRGWIVMVWNWHDNKGLRAWRSEPKPVRTAWGIQSLRLRLGKAVTLTDLERLQLKKLDLALVL
jgi:hypothetical protein